MRANQHKILAAGIIAAAIVTEACGGAVHHAPGPPPSDIDALLEALDNDQVPDPVLVTRILSTAPAHPDTTRSHVQCHSLRNIRTRPTIALDTIALDTLDVDGPSGELCAVDGGRGRDDPGGIHRKWIATAQINPSPPEVGGIDSVPHLGMAQGLNWVLAVHRTANNYEAVVFPPPRRR